MLTSKTWQNISISFAKKELWRYRNAFVCRICLERILENQMLCTCYIRLYFYMLFVIIITKIKKSNKKKRGCNIVNWQQNNAQRDNARNIFSWNISENLRYLANIIYILSKVRLKPFSFALINNLICISTINKYLNLLEP